MKIKIDEDAIRRLVESPEVKERARLAAEQRLSAIACPVHGKTVTNLRLVETEVPGQYRPVGTTCCPDLDAAIEAFILG